MSPVKYVLLGLVAIALSGCDERMTLLQDDGRVRMLEVRPGPLNVHGYTDYILVAKGEKYHHVWSGKDFFVSVPGRNAILFVTSKGGGGTETSIHVVDFDVGKHIGTKESKDLWFGVGLGYPKENVMADYIETAQPDYLILVSKSATHFYRYKMSLVDGSLEKLQMSQLGRNTDDERAATTK